MKRDSEFEEWVRHKSNVCIRKKCYYCEDEDAKLEQGYKEAKRLGYLGWPKLDDIGEF